jgi:uncharacterized lipoprotein YddW (UPF0748 family)
MYRREFLQSAATAAAAGAFTGSLPRAVFAVPVDAASAEPGWWMREPIRWLQTNLRETNSALDPKQFIADVANFNANVLMMNAGGITAHYPSNVQYEYVSPYLPKGRDMFGEVLKEAHARSIRVVSRWDFSVTQKEV